MTPTFCEDCDNVHNDTRRQSPSSWLCVEFPRLEGQGFIAPKFWAEKEPFMRCVGINGGACPLFKRRRNGQLEMPVNRKVENVQS